MNKSTVFLITCLFLGASQASFAGNTHDPLVNARQHHQKHRVINGVKSGELTAGETFKLYKQQKRINRLERSYKSDGKLTLRERRNLHKAQNRASRNIYFKKHNNRKRF